MTTQLKNVEFSTEINSFRDDQSKVSPLAIVHAMADLARSDKTNWFETKECKALVHSLNTKVHGADYKIDAKKERAWLAKVIS